MVAETGRTKERVAAIKSDVGQEAEGELGRKAELEA
jgi:hypothetical protein